MTPEETYKNTSFKLKSAKNSYACMRLSHTHIHTHRGINKQKRQFLIHFNSTNKTEASVVFKKKQSKEKKIVDNKKTTRKKLNTVFEKQLSLWSKIIDDFDILKSICKILKLKTNMNSLDF